MCFFSFSLCEKSNCPDLNNERATFDEEISGRRNKRDFDLTLPDETNGLRGVFTFRRMSVCITYSPVHAFWHRFKCACK